MTTLDWQKSSFSGSGDGNNCLELAATPTTLRLRESDTPATASPQPLRLSFTSWPAYAAGV
ncbi:DUF397 domain-containing protein [Streptomyces sp. NPDC052015]|uniref:DUF397 domain-containing protein n=1 Tax=Streptomyces sp. NPDC052015 TaxID=3154755 RepID=UPI0034466951